MAAFEISPASVTPLLRESLGIGAAAAGLVVSVMFGSAVLASLPAGMVLDRADTRRTMAGAVGVVFVTGLWSWWAGASGDFVTLLVARFFGGVGFVVAWNAGIDIVSEAVSEANRATAVSVFTASAPLGFALGQGLSPAIAGRAGWPAIFLVFPGLSVLGLLVFWPVSRGLGSAHGAAPSLSEFANVLRDSNVLLLSALASFGYGLYLFVNSWGPSYLTAEIGLSLGLSGLIVALFPAMGIGGRIAGGVLSDRLFGGRRRPIALVTFLVTAPLLGGFTVLRSVPLLVVTLLVAGFAIQLLLGLVFVYVRELVSPPVAATAVATVTTAGLGGAFVAPIIGGTVIDTAGYPAAFLGAGVLSALGLVLSWWAPEAG
jgi:predicted MFS family arabinose efflux permease